MATLFLLDGRTYCAIEVSGYPAVRTLRQVSRGIPRRDALLVLVETEDAEPGERNAFGEKFVVCGTLAGPIGRTADAVTVWIVPETEAIPRSVTAYPGEN